MIKVVVPASATHGSADRRRCQTNAIVDSFSFILSHHHTHTYPLELESHFPSLKRLDRFKNVLGMSLNVYLSSTPFFSFVAILWRADFGCSNPSDFGRWIVLGSDFGRSFATTVRLCPGNGDRI